MLRETQEPRVARGGTVAIRGEPKDALAPN